MIMQKSPNEPVKPWPFPTKDNPLKPWTPKRERDYQRQQQQKELDKVPDALF